MELTRRDALAALAATGGVVGAGALLASRQVEPPGDDEEPVTPADDEGPVSLTDDEVETLVAVARAVYPSAVSGVRTFVETYSHGRIERVQDDAYRRGVQDAVAYLDDRSRAWYDGDRYAELDAETGRSILHQIGAARLEADPTGNDAERVRHFLVNEVLFALYAAPAGGRLVGIENPQGYPGGIESYHREGGE